MDSLPIGTFLSVDPMFAKFPALTFVRPLRCTIQVTEIRLWAVALTEQIIKENWKCPLAMLYE